MRMNKPLLCDYWLKSQEKGGGKKLRKSGEKKSLENWLMTYWCIENLIGSLFDYNRCIDLLTDWFTDWMIYCLTNFLTDWLTDWLIHWLTGFLSDWFTSDWFTVWLIYRLADLQTNWLTDWLVY